MDFIDIGPQCFASEDESIISWKGQNYYRACDVFVAQLPDGGQCFCVKRSGHPGIVHEAYDGQTREEN